MTIDAFINLDYIHSYAHDQKAKREYEPTLVVCSESLYYRLRNEVRKKFKDLCQTSNTEAYMDFSDLQSEKFKFHDLTYTWSPDIHTAFILV